MKPQPAVNFNYDTLVVKYTAYNELEKKLKIAEVALNSAKAIINARINPTRESLLVNKQIDEVLQQIREK